MPWALAMTNAPTLFPARSNNPKAGSVHQWYNPASFALQAPGTIGNLGRNTLIGPGLMEFDMALAKMTQLTESLGMQFRVETFNIFNHPNYGPPNQDLYQGPENTTATPVASTSVCPGIKLYGRGCSQPLCRHH